MDTNVLPGMETLVANGRGEMASAQQPSMLHTIKMNPSINRMMQGPMSGACAPGKGAAKNGVLNARNILPGD